jgi:hypothetical protein
LIFADESAALEPEPHLGHLAMPGDLVILVDREVPPDLTAGLLSARKRPLFVADRPLQGIWGLAG